MTRLRTMAMAAACLVAGYADAQLSSNPDKFLGNITTSYNVDYGAEKYYTLWNQITCENESKWASIEGTNNSFNWTGSDRAFNYAKEHNFPFKFHALIWGAQYPSWLEKLTPEQRYKEIVQWMDEIKKHYPNLQLIDVVNEAITGHQQGTPYFIEALGGTGVTGYDWLIKAFELAYERWPDAILIYNDFNTFQWNTDQYIDLVRTLRNAGAPIDAYGCQSHDLTDCSFTNFKSAMTKLQNALKMPMYSTEYDIGTSDDAKQLQQYKDQIPYMWEQDYVAGITLWGYIYGRTWTTDGNSGIIKDGKDRPAMTWLREYMATDKAKNAKSPFPGMVKEASIYIKPQALTLEKGKVGTITVRARMKTKTIEKVALYAGTKLISTMTEAPYIAEYTPTTTGYTELKAVVTNTDGSTYTRYSAVTVSNPRAPYNNTPATLPGTLQAENFDSGADGIAFHDTNSNKEGDGASYRSDTGGIDVVKGGSGYAVGYTQVGEWMEYTVNVTKAGLYDIDINYSAPNDGGSVNLALSTPEGLVPLTANKLMLPKSGAWGTYQNAHSRLLIPLEEGEQIIRLTIAGGTDTYVTNIDYIKFTQVEENENLRVALASDPLKPVIGTKTTITADLTSESNIKNVKFYVDGVLNKIVTAPPYKTTFTPAAKGNYNITAFATDTDGKVSNMASYVLTATAKRSAFKNIELPGIFEAEDFDKGEEGLTFHDSDNKDEGEAKYRTDNEGVDIVKTNGGYVIGYTVAGEWLEYTVDVKEAGKYTCVATVSAGSSTSSFTISKVVEGKTSTLWTISVPQTGSWDTYKDVKNLLKKELEEGPLTLRITIKNGSCNIDKIELKCAEPTDIQNVTDTGEATYSVYTIAGVNLGTVKVSGNDNLPQALEEIRGNQSTLILKNIENGKSIKVTQ